MRKTLTLPFVRVNCKRRVFIFLECEFRAEEADIFSRHLIRPNARHLSRGFLIRDIEYLAKRGPRMESSRDRRHLAAVTARDTNETMVCRSTGA